MTSQLEQIKHQLSQARALGLPIKSDLYTHLTEVFNRIMLHHPHSAYDNFEQISRIVKETNFKISAMKTDDEVNSMAHQTSITQAEAWIEKTRRLI